MLILTRRIGETINIGTEGVKVTVMEIRGQQVRLGFDAPKDIPIMRDDIKRKENGKM